MCPSRCAILWDSWNSFSDQQGLGQKVQALFLKLGSRDMGSWVGGRGRDADAYREVCVIVPLIGGFNYGTEGKVFLFFDESSLVLDARCPC